ncbi:protein FAM90A27P-like [Elephas maximus indicus]|uniref:protein FAM90A27P-like n=1 Tax=Elephas maximus indicus TaxID=99487 RepID=UPI0021170499|nr:protein FAM90A27P-like [Elephas maximus indicus]
MPVDMMTEKWVVVASVEVLLRFPLMPGEDPRARCDSKKKRQPSVNQPHAASHGYGDQEGRKPNNRCLKKTEQRPEDLRKMTDHYKQQQSHGPPTVRNLKKRKRGAVEPSASPSEKVHTRVMCKNCGAFGHTEKSKRCPMKHWDGALALQPLGSNKKKENLEPRKPQEPHTRGSFNQTDRQKEQSQWQEEEQKKMLMQNIPRRLQEKQQTNDKELTDYLTNPTRPMPVQTAKKRPILIPVFTRGQHIKSSDMRSFCPTQSLIKRPELSSFLTPHVPGKGREVTFAESLHPSLKNPTLIAKTTRNRPDACSHDIPQSFAKTHTLGNNFHSQAQAKCPNVNPKPSSQPTTQKLGQNYKLSLQASGNLLSQVPTQTCKNLPKKPRLRPFHNPQMSTQNPSQKVIKTVQLPPSTNRLTFKEVPQEITMTAALAPHNTPHQNPVQACAVRPPPQSSHVPNKPLGTVFTGLDSGQKNSQFNMAPTFVLPKKPTPPDQSLHVLQDSERHCSHTPRSILYEDLLVSSSEESDRE